MGHGFQIWRVWIKSISEHKHQIKGNSDLQKTFFLTLLLMLLTCSQPLLAEDKSGVSPQVISLPKGPGSIEGLGESFEPQLNMGTSIYSFTFALPPGTNKHHPDLKINYNSGTGNGPLGIGWKMNIPYIQWQTDKGLPRYVDDDDGKDNDYDGEVDEPDERDTFIYSNGEELVPLNDGSYRFKNEEAFSKFRKNGDFWEGWLKNGTWLKFGSDTSSRIQDNARIFRWYLEEMRDTNGNLILFTYTSFSKSVGMVYIKEIRYSFRDKSSQLFHGVVFQYEEREDSFSDYRSGFEMRTNHRLISLDIFSQGATYPGSEYRDHNGDGIKDYLIRRYIFDYKTGVSFSLLSQIFLLGSDGINSLPPLSFDYTLFAPQSGQANSLVWMKNPPNYNLNDENTELIDLNGDALPDLLHTSSSGHYYFQNQGNGVWAGSMRIENSPDPSKLLSADGTSLADINGDGLTDLIAKSGTSNFLRYLNTGNNNWSESEYILFLGEKPKFPFDGDQTTRNNIRLIDINFDKNIDIMQTTNSAYYYWINLGDGRFSDRISSKVVLKDGNSPILFDTSRIRLADMNGDRLLDLVFVQSGKILYWPNKGNGEWDTQKEMTNAPVVGNKDIKLLLTDINADGISDLVLENARPGELDYWINLGNNSWGETNTVTGLPVFNSQTSIRIADMNGNGSTDILWCNPSFPDDKKYSYFDFLSTTPPNLLRMIDNGIGKRVLIEYSSSTAYYLEAISKKNPWPTRIPISVSLVSMVRLNFGLDIDGISGADEYISEYRYYAGYYDGMEKEFRGFSFCSKIEWTHVTDQTSETTVSRFKFHTGAPDSLDNDNDGETDEFHPIAGREEEPLKGRLLWKEVTTKDGLAEQDGMPASDEVVYEKEENFWIIRRLYEPSQGLSDILTLDERAVSFAFIRARDISTVELKKKPTKVTHLEYDYDPFGNMTEEWNFGINNDNGSLDDERFTHNSYGQNLDSWIVERLFRELITDEKGKFVSETRNYYDGEEFKGLSLGEIGTKGNLSRIEEVINKSGAVRDKARNRYDEYGNIASFLDANYGTSETNGHKRDFFYDSLFHTYPVQEKIFLEKGKEPLIFAADYHSGFGTMVASTDLNGNRTEYDYNCFGRLVKIIRPGDSVELPTTLYEYALANPHPYPSLKLVPDAEPLNESHPVIYLYDEKGNLTLKNPATILASSITSRSRENSGVNTTSDEITYYDGLGRSLETILEGQNKDYILKDAKSYNSRGQISYTYQPSIITSSAYQIPDAKAYKTELHYDGMKREVFKLHPPDENGILSNVLTQYFPMERVTLDEEDSREGSPHASTPQVALYDGLGRLIKVTEFQEKDMIDTFYTWDLLDNLIQIKDTSGNIKTQEFDAVGKKLRIDDPDMGIRAFEYDPFGNMIKSTDNKGLSIQYTYDGANRLTSEDILDEQSEFSYHRSPDIIYTYDIPCKEYEQAANTKGYRSCIYDPSGAEFFSYDQKGNVEVTLKRINVDETHFNAFTTKYHYDASDRLHTLEYPDGESVTYNYNQRSLVSSIPGIIESVEYQPSGQLLSLLFNNNIKTSYNYDPRIRLTSLATKQNQENNVIQDFHYYYDGVGNITFIKDQRSEFPVKEQNTSQSFQYDDLYRLTQSEGTGFGVIDYVYDKIGNMIWAGSPASGKPGHIDDPHVNLDTISYGTRINVDGAGPHAATGYKGYEKDKGQSYLYDKNGNFLRDNENEYLFDGKNQLILLKGANKEISCRYDYAGKRVAKSIEKQGKLESSNFFINKYAEIRDGNLYKYVFLNDNRVAQISSGLQPIYSPQEIPLVKGWNLISIFVEPDDPSIKSVLKSIDGYYDEIWTYNAENRLYLRFLKSSPDNENTLQNIHAQRGYWIYTSRPCILKVVGKISLADLEFKEGWNLTGFPNVKDKENFFGSSFLNGIYRSIWQFDSETQKWSSYSPALPSFLSELKKMTPDSGYWFDSIQNANISLSKNQEEILYYHKDHLTSSHLMTNQAGEVIREMAYYPYGRMRYSSSPDKKEHYSFTDKEYDAEMGLYYFGARYYNPVIGRFVSVDPLMVHLDPDAIEETINSKFEEILLNPGFLNNYMYSDDNPIIYIDPEGLASWPTQENTIIGNPKNSNAGYFGYSRTYSDGNPKWHGGVDIGGKINDPIYAFKNGVVIKASFQNEKNIKEGFGMRIVVMHTEMVEGKKSVSYSIYAHLTQMSVNVGDKIKEGQQIGKMGRSGNISLGEFTHLHFETRGDSYRGSIDPGSQFTVEDRLKYQIQSIFIDQKSSTIPETSYENAQKSPSF
jgi:RHS repeat-associated protein